MLICVLGFGFLTFRRSLVGLNMKGFIFKTLQTFYGCVLITCKDQCVHTYRVSQDDEGYSGTDEDLNIRLHPLNHSTSHFPAFLG